MNEWKPAFELGRHEEQGVNILSGRNPSPAKVGVPGVYKKLPQIKDAVKALSLVQSYIYDTCKRKTRHHPQQVECKLRRHVHSKGP